jgi:hypothetical protein
MKPILQLAASLALNLVLAFWLALRWQISVSVPSSGLQPGPQPAPEVRPKISLSPDPSPLQTNKFTWRMIESDDYRQYLANLRAAGCPEYLVRDILVADLDDLYAARAKPPGSVTIPPWQGADSRRAADWARLMKQLDLQAEKRALVKQLLGYPWDNHANEIWHQEFKLAMLLGFLTDDQASQTLALAGQCRADTEDVRAAAHDILIEEDRVRLKAFYDNLSASISQLLPPAELDELQLRIQAVGFFPANVHLEGVRIEGTELRELARLTRTLQDVVKTEVMGVAPLSASERAAREKLFAAQLKSLLGPSRLADYERAQDYNFRESFEFAQRDHLPEAAAVVIYNARQAAETRAAELKADASLTPPQQIEALDALRIATADKLSATLGNGFQDYLDGPGHWLQSLGPAVEPPSSTGSP